MYESKHFDQDNSSVPWFSMPIELRNLSLKEAAELHCHNDASKVEKIRAEAQELFRNAQNEWIKRNREAYKPDGLDAKSSYHRKGHMTKKDKLSLLCELLQNPRHSMVAAEAMKEIRDMLSTKSTIFHEFICDTIKELFLSDTFIPLARPLREFVHQPHFRLPKDAKLRSQILIMWFLEDHLKNSLSDVLSQMKDELTTKKWISSTSRKLNILRFLSEILHKLPEKTDFISGIIVNKLGSPNVAVSSRCSVILVEFMKKRSQFQQSVVTHLHNLLNYSSTDDKTRKMIVHIMNQIVFSHNSQQLPARCISIYVELFKNIVSKGVVEHRIINGIFTGMKRALPFATHTDEITKHLDVVFIMASASKLFHNRVSALNLLQFCIDKDGSGLANRFYRSLYHLIQFDPTNTPQSSHLTMFFSLIHQSLSKTHDARIIAAFIHRLLQASLVNSAAYACASLMIFSELLKCNPAVALLLQKQSTHVIDQSNSTLYDPIYRSPEYAHAENEPLWELGVLQQHYHPTVAKFASLLATGCPIVHFGNPLDDFSLLHFCELFVHKKPHRSMQESMSLHQRQRSSFDIANAEKRSAEVHSFVDRYLLQKKRRVCPISVKKAAFVDVANVRMNTDTASSSERKTEAKSEDYAKKYLRFESYEALDGILLGMGNEIDDDSENEILKTEEREMLSI